MKKFIYTLAASILCGCSSTETSLVTIASQYGAMCDGESSALCKMLIYKTQDNQNWYVTYPLKGFPYEQGYEYVIKVSGDAANTWEYEGTVSKKKKTSEGVSPYIVWDETWTEHSTPCEELMKRHEEK